MRAHQVLRQLSTVAHHVQPKPHTLTRSSPFVRRLDPTGSSGTANGPASLESDFQLYPDFFSGKECRQLLSMALWKLDRADSTRRRRRNKGSVGSAVRAQADDLQDLFEGEYGFEEGHYDSVIHHYRETLLSNFPPPDKAWPDIQPLMKRMYDLLPAPTDSTTRPHATTPPHGEDGIPPRGTSTHLLHLAPHGAILPHVDNLEASGSVIIGTSLGAERVLRLKDKEGESGWDVRLPSGSLYLQRDAVRYRYEHSILSCDDDGSVWDGKRLETGHRVSLMVRDAPARNAKL